MSTKPYQSGFFRSSWLFTITVLSTLKTCLRVLVLPGSSRPDFRSRMDKLLQRWGKRLLQILHVKMSVMGEGNLQFEQGRAYMIMCSHTSNYDIPATFAVIPGSIRMLAKKELKKLPIFGHAITRSEMVFVDRKNRREAVKDLARAKQRMEDGIILWVAPEGTRTAGPRKVGRLKKGGFQLALDTGAIIIPLAFRGIDDVQLLKKFRWTLHKPVECHIGKGIDTRRYSKKQTSELMADFETELKKLVGVIESESEQNNANGVLETKV